MNENNEMMTMEEQGCHEFVIEPATTEEQETKSGLGFGILLGSGITVGAYLLGKKARKLIHKARQKKVERIIQQFEEEAWAEEDPEVVQVIQEESTDNDSKK